MSTASTADPGLPDLPVHPEVTVDLSGCAGRHALVQTVASALREQVGPLSAGAFRYLIAMFADTDEDVVRLPRATVTVA